MNNILLCLKSARILLALYVFSYLTRLYDKLLCVLYIYSYTPTELRYFPLNTVLYGPMKPNERQEPGTGSDGSQSDSDDSSSSDDSR
jgi:hypothetical protein